MQDSARNGKPHDPTPGGRRGIPGFRRNASPQPEPEPRVPIEESIPRSVRIAGAWSWRLLVIGAVIAVVIFLIIELREIVIPVLVAVLVAALLVPFKTFLQRHGWPTWLAIVTAMLALIVIVGGLVYLAVFQVVNQFGELKSQSIAAYDGFRDWLTNGPLQLSTEQINQYLNSAWSFIQADSRPFITGALSLGSSVAHLFTGLLLALFSTLFILIDGSGIWAWIVRIFPRRSRAAVDGAGKAGWTTLRNFVRVQILVASIDAAGIGLFAFFLQLPLVIPIAVLVFLGSFIPIVGAVLTGALAVIVALLYNGWLAALIMLAGVLLVQQVEGHVLQPLIMGTAVKVHPLAVVLVVAAGSLLAGIPGALFAVPVAAVLNVMIHYVSSGVWRESSDREFPLSSPLWQTVPRTGRRQRE
jgi:putative heme transporter